MTGHKYSVIYFVWSNTHSSTQCHQVFFCVCWFSIFIAHCCVRTNMSVWTFVLLVNEIFEWLFQHRHIPNADWAYDQEEEIIVTATRRIFVATMRCNFSNTFFIANKLKGFIVGQEDEPYTQFVESLLRRKYLFRTHSFNYHLCCCHANLLMIINFEVSNYPYLSLGYITTTETSPVFIASWPLYLGAKNVKQKKRGVSACLM